MDITFQNNINTYYVHVHAQTWDMTTLAWDRSTYSKSIIRKVIDDDL